MVQQNHEATRYSRMSQLGPILTCSGSRIDTSTQGQRGQDSGVNPLLPLAFAASPVQVSNKPLPSALYPRGAKKLLNEAPSARVTLDSQAKATRRLQSQSISQSTVNSIAPRTGPSNSHSEMASPVLSTKRCTVEGCKRTKPFARNADLRRHVEIVHQGAIRISCKHVWCGRVGEHGFTRRDHYHEHLRDVHVEKHIQNARLKGLSTRI